MERLIRVLGILTRWGLGLCALLAVLVALYVSLGRELAPLVAEYRVEVQTKASDALGMPLRCRARNHIQAKDDLFKQVVCSLSRARQTACIRRSVRR